MLASKLVRILAIVVAGLVALAPLAARADQRADLQQQGEQQAKEGRFADAIDSFKAADRIEERASHACLIALAYTRRELWSQAQHWMLACHARASASDPLPDWTPLAEKQIKERLETSSVAAVTIVVKPATVKARVTVSSFAPDETFEPRTIHLAPGTHVVFAKAEGYPDRQQTVEVRDKTPTTVTIDWSDVTPVPPTGGGERDVVQPPPTPAGPDKPNNSMSTGLIIGGAALVLVGGLTHWRMGVAANDMNAARKDFMANEAMYRATMTLDTELMLANETFDAAGKRYDRFRVLSLASYAIGAGLVVTGVLIRKKVSTETAVSATPLPEGGAFVSVGWSR